MNGKVVEIIKEVVVIVAVGVITKVLSGELCEKKEKEETSKKGEVEWKR